MVMVPVGVGTSGESGNMAQFSLPVRMRRSACGRRALVLTRRAHAQQYSPSSPVLLGHLGLMAGRAPVSPVGAGVSTGAAFATSHAAPSAESTPTRSATAQSRRRARAPVESAASAGARSGDRDRPYSEMDKKERRLLKNREAAKECRRKKKEYVKCLEDRVEALEAQNLKLMEELRKSKGMFDSADGTHAALGGL